MDAHGHLHETDMLQNAVACLMHETRYQCSVIHDFDLPSNYFMFKPKLPVKKTKHRSNTRSKREKDKERKRMQREVLKREVLKDDVEKKSTSRFQTLYKTKERYREDKKEYGRKRYSSNFPYQLAKKRCTTEKYKSNIQFKESRKDYIKNKYKSNIQFRQEQKDYTKNKYKLNFQFRQSRKDYIRKKYRINIPFQQAQKYYTKMKYKVNILFQNAIKKAKTEKYASDKDYRNREKTLNLLRYRQNVLFREKCKKRQRQLYRSELKYREKKILLVQQRRTKDAGNIATWFRQQVMDGPRYICSVCIKVKFKKQVVQLDKEKYVKKGKQSAEVANRCINIEFKLACTVNCEIKCEIINHKLWICYTCHRHLLQSKIPADATANGLQLSVIPEELKSLNVLEKQLISQRIPFMKLVQLPKGKQRGIIGPCVSIPTDIQKTVTILPRSYDDTQLVRCKLKRKQSYIGYSQYEFISTNKIYKALESLKESNPYYKNTSLNQNWHDEFPPDFEDLTVAEEDQVNSEISVKQDMLTQQSDEDPQEEDQNVKDRGFPCDTCLQPVDIGQEISILIIYFVLPQVKAVHL